MQITIPKGTQINTTDEQTVKIRIPNTQFWVEGTQNQKKTWDIELTNPTNSQTKTIAKNIKTKTFATISATVLKTPFPYQGKNPTSITAVTKFIKNLIK